MLFALCFLGDTTHGINGMGFFVYCVLRFVLYDKDFYAMPHALCFFSVTDTENGHGHVFNVKGLKGEGG